MNKILRRPVAIVLLAGILVTCFSCVRDKIDMAQQDGDIDLHITIKQSEESRLGRAKSDRVDRNRIEDMNIVMAMNMGGDDFIAKPFDLQVLTAKLQAVLRRSYGSELTSHSMECGEVVLNLHDTSAAVRGEKIDLTKNEFLILKTLMEKQGKVVSREEIMERLWGNDEFVDDNTLTVNITRIRKKLEAAGVNDFITTKRGLGYLVGA